MLVTARYLVVQHFDTLQVPLLLPWPSSPQESPRHRLQCCSRRQPLGTQPLRAVAQPRGLMCPGRST